MAEQMQFRVVDDRYRDEPADVTAVTQALLEDRTLFLPEAKNSFVSTLYSRIFKKYRRRLRRRQDTVDGTPGFVVWLDPPDDGAL